MLRAKIALIYTAITILSGSFLVWLASVWGFIALDPAQATAAIIGPLLGFIVAAVNAKHIFDDPDAVIQLKHEQADVLLATKKAYSDRESQIVKHHEALHAKDAKSIAEQNAEVAKWQRTAIFAQNKPKTLSARPAVIPVLGGNETAKHE